MADRQEDLKGDDRKEAERNNEAARLWISGLEAVNRKLGLARIIDLSATPFFLRGSGYAEGTLFPRTMSDFSLMDAIECGIVKLPRVPVAENIPGDDMPMFRNLWENIRKDMPRKGRGKAETLDPLALPTRLQTALQALYGHYETSRTHRWQTDAARCHVNWVVLDSDWEAEFCRVAESHPRVKAYAKNHNLGLEVPYRYGSETRRYLPDFVVLVDDGHGDDDLLHLVVEIKGYRREDAKEKKSTMDTYWVPAVNNLRTLGRWAFAELTEIYQIQTDFKAKVEAAFNEMIERAGTTRPAVSARQSSACATAASRWRRENLGPARRRSPRTPRWARSSRKLRLLPQSPLVAPPRRLENRGVESPQQKGEDDVKTARDRVSAGVMHLAKGLEFRAVAVMACDDEVVPLQSRIEAVTDDGDLEEVYETERHLLYVACTRARDNLLVTGVSPASEFLDDLRG